MSTELEIQQSVPRWTLEIGGHRTVADLENTLIRSGIRVSDWAASMMRSPEFAAALQREPETVDLALLSVGDLRFSGVATTRQIFDRANELGLAMCDPRVGPYQRFADRNQEVNNWYWIAMEPIADSHGYPYVFALARREGGAWLDDGWAYPDHGWAS